MAVVGSLVYNGYNVTFISDGSINLEWQPGASRLINAESLWNSFKVSSIFTSSAFYATHSTESKFSSVYGGSGADTITKSSGGEIFGYDGDDIINAFATGSSSQQHIWGGGGNDTINLNFSNIGANAYSSGHHVRGDSDGALVLGNDIFNFTGLGSVTTGKTVVGRIEDFDASRDTVKISGVTINLFALPSNAKIVVHIGNFNDAGADPSQWLVIHSPAGGYVVYALEGARVDMNGDGLSNGGQQELHFNTPEVAAAIIAQSIVQPNVLYIDPQNAVPLGAVAQGGVTINDYDDVAADASTVILGRSSGDLIAAGLNNDTVNAGAGNDQIWGGSGHDVLLGEAGNDTIAGGTGNDSMDGGIGDDTFLYTTGDSTIVGGSGVDTLVFQGATPVNLSLFANTNDRGLTISGIENIAAGSGADSIIGNASANTLIGNEGNDTLSGYGGNDVLYGGDGDDSHWGLQGNDTLNGGAGDDKLTGGSGIDVLTGGAGNDLFQFYSTADGADTITDFGAVAGNDDLFYMQASGFGGGLTTGALATSKFWSSTTGLAHDSDDRFIFNANTKELYFDVDGNGAAGPVLLATLQAGVANLTAADFLLF